MVPGTRLVILGKQGAGKGTQCVRLARHYVVPHISTGDMLRAAVRAGTEIGMRAKEYMDAGELVPSEVMVGVVKLRLEMGDTYNRGFILDGFPRTTGQAEDLEEILLDHGVDLDLAIDLELDTEVALARLASRRVCSTCGTNYNTTDNRPKYDAICDTCGGDVVQRDDDTEVSIKRRLALYEQETSPLIAWYDARGKLAIIDGSSPPDEVTAQLIKEIDQRRHPGSG